MNRLQDGTAVAIVGNAINFRTAFRLSLNGVGDIRSGLRFLPMASVAPPYFVAAGRLFRGEPGQIEWLETVLGRQLTGQLYRVGPFRDREPGT